MNPEKEKNKGNANVQANNSKRFDCRECPYVAYIDEAKSFCGVCYRNIYLEMRRKFKKAKEG